MAIGFRKWCDFVVSTNVRISIQQIFFDEIFWTSMDSKFVFILLLLCLNLQIFSDFIQ